MLFFRSEEDLQAWGTARNLSLGATLSLEQLWALSKLWYGNRLEEDFHGRSPKEALGLFQEVGLNGKFWEL